MQFIKQSTATALMIGPFLDSTDGYSLRTSLSIPSGLIRLSKNGGAFATTASAISLTHNESGWYSGTFNTTDTNTVGNLIVSVYASGALPVWKEYVVLPAMIYDGFIAGSASLTVTSSGLSPVALGSIVSSGNAAGWNTTNANVTGIVPAALTQIVNSGNAAGWNTTNANITGLVPAALSQIVASGTAAGWQSGPVTVSGLTQVAVDRIIDAGISGGFSNNWTPVTVSTTSLNNIVSTVIASGDAAGWDGVNPVTVSGYTPYALSQIISSGTAAGWGSTSDVSAIVSGVWNHTIDVIDAEAALKYVLAYTTGDSSRSGTSYTYKNYNNSSDVLQINGSGDGRSVTKY